jgi:hypothetical protein
MLSEPLEQFYELAKKAAGLEAEGSEGTKAKSVAINKRCKWWNRGFCWEREKCSFGHEKNDCQDHLQGGCTTKGCNTLRHRKQCRYFCTEQGCHRGDQCEYLHLSEKEKNLNKQDKECMDKGVQIEEKKEFKDIDIQTVAEEICICKEECKTYNADLKKR